jgi:hypothetical protein
VYHVELRQFPHNFCRFNLTERELHETILDGWARGEWIEFGERKWNSHQASLTVLHGPRLPVDQLSIGRGWRNAKRQGQDVTEQLLAEVRASAGVSAGTHAGAVVATGPASVAEQRSSSGRETVPDTGAGSGPDIRLAADSLGLEVLAKLGDEPVPVATAWWLARDRYPERSASDCLELAELAVRSLAEAGLAVVLAANDSGEYEPCESEEMVEQALRAIDGWSSLGASAPVSVRKA